MNKQKTIARIASISILSTSILASMTLSSFAYDYNETIYKKGSQIIRSYSSTKSSSSDSSSSSSAENNKTSNTYSNNNETIYKNGGQIVRSYSSTKSSDSDSSSSNSTEDNKNNDSDTTNNSNSNTENNDSTQSNKKIYTGVNETVYKNGSQIVRVYGSNSSSDNTSTNNNETNTSNTANSDDSNINPEPNGSKTLTDKQIESMVLEMLTLINNERSKNNLNPLKLDDKLTSLAQLKAEDMVENDYLSHNSRKYGTVYAMLNNAAIKYYNAGENIAKAFNVESAHKNFMNSGMHRMAILAPHFTHVGIGIDKQARGMYKISVMFIEKK